MKRVRFSPKELVEFNLANHLLPQRELKDYQRFTSLGILRELEKEAKKLEGKKILRINATPFGGGVAEMIPYFTSLLQNLKIEVDWLTMASPFGHQRGFSPPPSFFGFTSGLHYALQDRKNTQVVFEKKDGQIKKRLAEESDWDLFIKINERFAKIVLDYQKKTGKADIVIVDDPQCLPIVSGAKQKGQIWLWRFHPYGDPLSASWNLLKPYILRYDRVVATIPEYLPGRIRKKVQIKQNFPFFDPFHRKLKQLPQRKIEKVLREFRLDPSQPILAQISRYDPDKDPLGVIETYKILKERYPKLQMVYIGNSASDNPVSLLIIEQMERKIRDYGFRLKKDVFLLHSKMKHPRPLGSFYLELSAIWYHPKSYLIQLSSKEGFGLVVSEAAWCGQPVVASRIGGIIPQIIHNKTGFLVKPGNYKKVANYVSKLIKNPNLKKGMGLAAKEHVRKNFLITSNLLQWLKIVNSA